MAETYGISGGDPPLGRADVVALAAMAETYGISGGGRSAEEMFRELTGASKAPTASAGDAILEGCPVEVKKATSNTLNQVRAVKYIPLVAFHEPSGYWYVVPAHVIVAEVSRKRRGQHTENPFESNTLSIGRLVQSRVEDPSELRSRTMNAIEASSHYPGLKHEMRHILDESRRLADDSVERVRRLLTELNIEVDPPPRRRRSAEQAGRALRDLLGD